MRSSVFALLAFAAIETQAHAFQSCEVPSFEWAAYGNRVTGRMYGMTAAVNDNHIFAGGFLKSTLEDPEAEGFVESTTDYAITGPYTTSDWDGTNAKTITVDLQSYPTTGGAKENAGGSWRAYEAGVVKIDKTTGEPVLYPGAAHHRPPLTAYRPPPPSPTAATFTTMLTNHTRAAVPDKRVRVLRRGHGRDHRDGGGRRLARHLGSLRRHHILATPTLALTYPDLKAQPERPKVN